MIQHQTSSNQAKIKQRSKDPTPVSTIQAPRSSTNQLSANHQHIISQAVVQYQLNTLQSTKQAAAHHKLWNKLHKKHRPRSWHQLLRCAECKNVLYNLCTFCVGLKNTSTWNRVQFEYAGALRNGKTRTRTASLQCEPEQMRDRFSLKSFIATGEAQVARYTSSACPRTPKKTGDFQYTFF
jgi:hypothetical protein